MEAIVAAMLRDKTTNRLPRQMGRTWIEDNTSRIGATAASDPQHALFEMRIGADWASIGTQSEAFQQGRSYRQGNNLRGSVLLLAQLEMTFSTIACNRDDRLSRTGHTGECINPLDVTACDVELSLAAGSSPVDHAFICLDHWSAFAVRP